MKNKVGILKSDKSIMSIEKVLLIDNYDSFTYNIVHYLQDLGGEVTVLRNDNKLLLSDLSEFNKVLISPGPGLPSEAGLLMEFLNIHHQHKSILGICLGQQALAIFFGGKLQQLTKVHHGISASVKQIAPHVIYREIPNVFQVGLYHSWHTISLPPTLIPTSISSESIVMSLKHNQFDIHAVQYHPESVMTPYGKQILKNWLFNL